MARWRPSHYFHSYRPFYRHGPYYGHYWRHYGRRWPWFQPFGYSGPTSSSFVAWAQSVLATLFGPAVPQDGYFGPETRSFVQRFQAQQGMPPTGDLDGGTVAALQAASRPEPPMPAPPPVAPPIFAAPQPMPPPDAPPAQDVPPPPPVQRDHRHPPQSQESEIAAEPMGSPERG
ncbi:MAG: peptidoglycan-binding protein, partial [Myxococcales bacterium]|nr:peptidoglycan-binding protein [Alphaproteobacteria bacterium]MBV9947391.1 peptidoglycan-binding protein [Myxococcales bacterium]